MKEKIKNNNFKTKGCKQCLKGEKSVLFITGLCNERCYYCPISDQKNQKDVIYINEVKITRISQAIEEIRLCDSKGVGITGGDPLVKLTRTINYIKKFKETFGKDFHIHLYTPLREITKAKLKKLHDSGLDEIRFHPNLYTNKDWDKIKLAKEFDWMYGIELPLIPNKKNDIKKMIEYMIPHIKFININELELSDTNASKLVQMGYKSKDNISYGVKNSERFALEILNYIKEKGFKGIRYCSAHDKDFYQMRKRITKRAENVAKEYDYISDEGMLIRGSILVDEQKVKDVLNVLKIYYEEELFEFDKKRKTILCAPEIIYDIKTNKNQLKDIINPDQIAIVEDYPTVDCFNVRTEVF